MKSSFRQHLLKWRASLGAITLLCLLWHILLPTMVHTGVVPALYAMPSHCQVTEIQNSLMGSESHSGHHQHTMNEMHQQHLHVAEHHPLSKYAKEVFALASQIMKHCPLCTHGLDAAVIVPLIALVLLFVLGWFSRIRCLCHVWTEDLHIPRLFYIFPIKQAPPLAL
ncbi:hypothetical protein QTA56_02475 [Acinetobacter sp. VNH17]|uniref:DUF2946 domain-containing protein n=1 Tax=Acinetobacter thutiue TaxID=2998078 RepID=A0ABT7WKD0_9GAMM|nr:hypothetical protein [Acinetobacter thutiue]MCY6411001.1 hypothetical protein [Acinetobacter thutiue]MDN0013103.1 hypothetical protein [Acinetobacter thutiue]